jgi:hypothetical protein
LNVEERLESIEKRVQKLEDALAGKGTVSSKPSKSEETESMIVSHIDKIGIQDLVVIALKLKPRQTKSEIKQMLIDLGKNVGVWFEGGNFNGRLVKKSIVKIALMKRMKTFLYLQKEAS